MNNKLSDWLFQDNTIYREDINSNKIVTMVWKQDVFFCNVGHDDQIIFDMIQAKHWCDAKSLEAGFILS